MTSLIFINIGILLALSLIHFYWALGGSWGVQYIIPDKFQSNYFNPKNKLRNMISTLIVAHGLILLAVVIASNYFNLSFIISSYWSIIGTRVIGSIFLLRAIGDFNIMGLFKKHSKSKFAQNDNRIFVPLCLYLGISSILITLI